MGTGETGPPTAARTSPEIPEPPIPQTSTCSTGASPRPARSTPEAAAMPAANCSGRLRTASVKARVSITGRGSSGKALSSGSEGGRDALLPSPGQERLGLVAGEDGRLVDEHHRDVVAHLVAAATGRAEQEPVGLEVVQRPILVGAGQDLQQAGVEGHGGYASRMMARTSSVARAQVSLSGASRLRRRSGSVVD